MKRRWMRGALMVVLAALLAGCLGEQVVEKVTLQEPDSVQIAVDGSGWLVSTPHSEAQRVLSVITIETARDAVSIVWRNLDERTHELMFGEGHSGHSFRLAPGEATILTLEAGFEQPFHSHYALELGEPQLRIVPSGA